MSPTKPKSTPRPRRPGRPEADGADLRQRLLDAALARFVAQGIAATPLRDVAKAAGVTPALVHYYFGSKDKLLAAVLQERLLPVVGEMAAAFAGSDASGDLLSRFVSGMYAVVDRHPWLPSLWVREILSEGGGLREFMLGHVAPQLPQKLAQYFAAEQKAGRLNPELDPRLTVVSLIGLTMFPLAGRPIWSRIFDAGDIDTQKMQRHTLALLRQGLENHDAT
ncbi:TetR/AcrR family transcriptional regulator [Arenimonas sp.]|uniref:TetR/AcrR family transcriptional regulator n=1 Tax=Arenimonas sp. TaxID=1872635 RepID=UPI0039E312F6